MINEWQKDGHPCNKNNDCRSHWCENNGDTLIANTGARCQK